MTQTATRFETVVQTQQTTAPVIYEYQRYYRIGNKYYNPFNGESISKSRYSQLRREAGVVGRTRTYFQQPNEVDAGKVEEYRQQLLNQGVVASPAQIARRADFQVVLANLSDETGRYDVLGANGRYKTLYPADSNKAWALVQLGLREPDWTWPVGESDEHK